MAAKKPVEAFTTVTVKPIGGALDTRSEVEDVSLGAWRWLLNMRLRDGTKLYCREGFERAFASDTPYVNADLHDQGYVAWPNPPREFITLLFESDNPDGSRTLYAGTQTRLYVFSESTGLWTNLVDNIGPPAVPGLSQVRFHAADLQNTILFVNNVNAPLYTVVGTTGISQVPGLNALNISTAGVVVEFAGFMLIMDVIEDGVRQSSRIWWSDFNAPLSWGIPVPPAVSLSNFQDLDYGSQILAAVPMAGALYIFTTTAIWRCVPTGDTSVFSFQKVYSEPLNQAGCLLYPNTLVSTGTGVWYASQEAIYYYDPYQVEPVREEWLFRGGAVMFSDQSALDPSCCQSPVACVKPEDKEIYVSWPEVSSNADGGCVNSKTLVFNYQYKACSIYDHGFSAMANFRPDTSDSAACKGATQMFLAASCTDLCLKNIGVNFSREMLTNTTGVGKVVNGVFVPFTGQYQAQGYYRIMRTLLPLLNFDREKWINHMLMEAIPAAQVSPCVMRFRLGSTFSECDPNLPDGFCSVLWHQLKDLPLKCLDTMTASDYVKKNLSRNRGFEWFFLYSGRFLYAEWTIANADLSPAIGGDCVFSRFECDVQLQTK